MVMGVDEKAPEHNPACPSRVSSQCASMRKGVRRCVVSHCMSDAQAGEVASLDKDSSTNDLPACCLPMLPAWACMG